MGQDHRPHSLLSHKGQRLAGQEVQAVHVLGVVGDDKLALGGKLHHGLKHEPLALLDILTHGVQVGGKLHAGGEQALALLALALAVELLPPLGKEPEAGLVAGQQLHLLAALVQGVAGSGILPGGVLRAAHGQLGHGLGGTAHELFNVDAGYSDGQQAHSGEHGEAAAHVVGHHELLVALRVGQALQGAAGLIGGGIDALPGALLAVLLLQQGLEDTEGHSGLGGGTGLGDDVHREVPVADEGDGLQQSVGGQTVAGKQDVGGVLLLQVIIGGCQQVDDGAGAQIGAADADDNQHLGLLLNLLGSGLDAGKLLLIIVPGQIHPAGEVAARAVMVGQHGGSLLQARHTLGQVVLGDKTFQFRQI